MAGSNNLFDSVQYTASSEYSTRGGRAIRYLQIHHATMTSLSGLISLMQPGGRTVSANGALGNDGHLVEVVPLAFRAFTSATSFDQQCLTVETCNTTLSPTWGISTASRERLARLAVSMYRQGLLGGLTRQYIIGHYEVPGTYATACPGPDMNLDWIVRRAQEIYNNGSDTAGGGTTPIEDKDIPMEMYLKAENGVIFRVIPGVKVNFETAQDYANWRSVMETYINTTPGAKNVLPPTIDKVMGISWAAYEQVKRMYGIEGD